MRLFEYAAPQSLDEAIAILQKAPGEVRPLAGGTDLIAQMKESRRQPAVVLDVKKIPELTRLVYDDRAGLRIGAAVPCADIANHPIIRERYPIIADSSQLVGSVQIQSRASIGGNICNAAPSADTLPGLIVLGARAIVIGPKGKREVPVEAFFKGPGQTVLGPQELLIEIVVPPPPANSAASYLRFTPRAEMDIAVVGVGSLIILDGGRRCKEARIALAAVAPTPVRAKEAEAVLTGKAIDATLISEAAEKAVLAARPISDVRASAEYRKELVKVLTRRTLANCAKTLGLAL